MTDEYVLAVFLGGCAVWDLRAHRIPNWWVILGMTAGMAFRGTSFWLPWLAVTTAGFPLFLCRMMGAGDIKTAAVLAGFLGAGEGFCCIYLGMILAAVAALLKLTHKKTLMHRISYFSAYVRRIIQTKTVTAYCSPERDGYDDTMPMGCYFLAGYWLYLAAVR